MTYNVRQGFSHEVPGGGAEEWYTPREIFTALGMEFDMDVCSPGKGVVSWIPARKHLTKSENGLMTDWNGRVWVNPPYGRNTGIWLDKLSEHGNGIALVMSRTDTVWFHRNIPYADAICFIKGRLSFVLPEIAADYAKGLVEPKGNCGAGSILLAYGSENVPAVLNCGLGWIIDNRNRVTKSNQSELLFN